MSKDLFKMGGINGYVQVNSFWGGERNKHSIQITPPMCGYIQFTLTDARKFARKILKETEVRRK